MSETFEGWAIVELMGHRRPALVLLADTLRVTRGPAEAETIAKLLGHALDATGSEIVPKQDEAARHELADRLNEAWEELRSLPLGGRGHLADICLEAATAIRPADRMGSPASGGEQP